MGLFGKKKKKVLGGVDAGALAQRSLDFITEAVLVIDPKGMIKFANPAAGAMTGFGEADNITGLDYKLVIFLEDAQQHPVEPTENPLYTAIMLNRPLNTRNYVLVAAQSENRIAIDLACIPTGDETADRLVTFRDITTELAREHEQSDFISTASHEMRTPVASIEGYLGLALNPQTATIDERAKKYLEAAHAASQHLGRLFKDLLDVTKFDDDRAKIHLIPVDAVEAVAYIANEQIDAIEAKKLRYSFGGAAALVAKNADKKRLTQKIYMAVDYDFLREIVNNLLGNAIKYTPEGGEITINVKGDGDKVVISVTDNGIGIPSEDLAHIFQKFYRVDNSQTRQIGGTGLGLYLVKERAEAMGGRVWAESDFGHGSTFYVSLPRISESEYEKMRIAYGNEKMVRTPFVAPVVGTANLTLNAKPANVVERTVTGASSIQIQPSGQSLKQVATESAAGAVSASDPAGARSSAAVLSGAGSNAAEQSETSSMIASHKMLDSDSAEVPSHLPPAVQGGAGETATETAIGTTPAEEPQIFERKSKVLQPKSATAVQAGSPQQPTPAAPTTTDSNINQS